MKKNQPLEYGFIPKHWNKELYARYLATNHWKTVSRLKRESVGNCCEIRGCLAPPPYHVHHLQYGNFWNEHLWELQVLCAAHHKIQHAGEERLVGLSPKPLQTELQEAVRTTKPSRDRVRLPSPGERTWPPTEIELAIERLKTEKGGFTRKGLESIGVKWPPKKGWKKRLIRDAEVAAGYPDRFNLPEGYE